MKGKEGKIGTKTGRKRMRRVKFVEDLKPYIMVCPAILFLAVFTFYPMINMIYLSFFDYNMISEKTFVGLENYRRLFTVNIDFKNSLRNTFVYTIAVVFFLILLGLAFALWLQKSSKLNAIAQRVMYLPHICAMLSVAMVFEWLMDEEGLFNAVLNIFNLPGLRWLNSSDTALISIVIVAGWKSIGYYALILLGSLRAIPAEINEAAALDDAGPLRKFVKITLPMLSPQIFFLIITITMNSFKVFESVRVLTNGGPGNSTDVLVFYIYRYAFQSMKVGYACSAGTVLTVILMIFSVFYFRSMGRKVHYQ